MSIKKKFVYVLATLYNLVVGFRYRCYRIAGDHCLAMRGIVYELYNRSIISGPMYLRLNEYYCDMFNHVWDALDYS